MRFTLTNQNKLLFIIILIVPSLGHTQTQPTPPPCSDPEFSDFDFWLGAWDVRLADGTLAGQNMIKKVHGGCLVTESWVGASGSQGTSINYFDHSAGEWVQVWNDANGTQIHIRGGLTDAGMLLVGKIHYISSGTDADFRGLWTPLEDGRVRQFFEQSTDGGETWAVWFEGFYSRVELESD